MRPAGYGCVGQTALVAIGLVAAVTAGAVRGAGRDVAPVPPSQTGTVTAVPALGDLAAVAATAAAAWAILGSLAWVALPQMPPGTP